MRRMTIGGLLLAAISLAAVSKVSAADNTPPEGFTLLFNGKDLTGWKGLVADPPKRGRCRPTIWPKPRPRPTPI